MVKIVHNSARFFFSQFFLHDENVPSSFRENASKKLFGNHLYFRCRWFIERLLPFTFMPPGTANERENTQIYQNLLWIFFGRDRFECEYIDDIEGSHLGIAKMPKTCICIGKRWKTEKYCSKSCSTSDFHIASVLIFSSTFSKRNQGFRGKNRFPETVLCLKFQTEM